MKGKTCTTTKFHRTDLVTCSHSRERTTPSYSQINTVGLIICYHNLSIKFFNIWTSPGLYLDYLSVLIFFPHVFEHVNTVCNLYCHLLVYLSCLYVVCTVIV